MLLRRLQFCFPVRLLYLHLRNHIILMALWVVLVLMALGLAGRFFGMHYLLLTPEYRGKTDFWSFFITGAAMGVLFMIWHLTTYLLCASRFPFLATLEAPFTKFSLNNSLIPFTFLSIYLSAGIWFQWHDEYLTGRDIALNTLGLLSGLTALILLLAAYLYFTNKDIGAFLRPGKMVFQMRPGGRLLTPGYRLPTVWEIQSGITRWRVDTYLNERLRLRLVRSVLHYNPEMLEQVFRQNHFNAVVVQVLALLVLLAQGAFMDSEWMRIPAAASLFILASMLMAIFGAITFWFRGWSLAVTLLLVVLVNMFTSWGFLNYRNRAYGLHYGLEERVPYTYARLDSLCSPRQIARDKAATQQILEKWLTKNQTPEQPKPKMVFICASGGGLRSALWTMKTIQGLDSVTHGRLLRHTILISGASGGMLGAAYYREARGMLPPGQSKASDSTLLQNISKDLLNPVSFGIVANDLFFPMTTFSVGGETYRKDRGYLFEQQLIENCAGSFNRPLDAYRAAEANAQIPMMVLSPFIVNDSRRLIISPQSMSYLMRPPNKRVRAEIDAVDMRLLFSQLRADKLQFSSALRMNCTYPLILPNAWLPSKPSLEVMDAGFRDNFGTSTAVRFIHTFQDWIRENTSGVIIIQVRSWSKIDPIYPYDDKGIFESLLTPAGAAANLTTMQDFEHDSELALLGDLLGPRKLDVLHFQYRPVRKRREASLSFHLSAREKKDVIQAFYQPENKAAVAAFRQIFR